MPLKGVYLARRKNGKLYFRASFTYKNKHISIGSYTCEKIAHQAYLQAIELASNRTISIKDYDPASYLAFEKWVSILNFRDSNYYFSNPIYLRPRFFSYYISPEEELFFDVDDLFYYSNHKIHKRDGYYFVNDFGMQINILSRYNIKNHAVLGRDYRFVDGDNHNLRYENIDVINPYYGVFVEGLKGKPVYKVILNLNGPNLVGRYKTLNEAAVAYNKAIDLVHATGKSKKNFVKNYLADLKEEAYRNLYKEIEIKESLYK